MEERKQLHAKEGASSREERLGASEIKNL